MEEKQIPPLPEVPAHEAATGWGWSLRLLWIYSMLLVGAIIVAGVVGTFVTPERISVEQRGQDSIVSAILFVPVAVFVVISGLKNRRS